MLDIRRRISLSNAWLVTIINPMIVGTITLSALPWELKLVHLRLMTPTW